MKFLFGNQVMFVIFVFLKFVEVKTQTACSLRTTIRLHMLVIQVLHEDYIVPTKWILPRIWFHSWPTALQMDHLAH
jgi:hypothetical protein